MHQISKGYKKKQAHRYREQTNVYHWGEESKEW